MSARRMFLRLAWLGLSLAASGLTAAPKPVLAHYMPWYVAKPHSSTWGWHWTMNHFNPDLVAPDGRRPVASHYYPLIGPYDSADPVVLEYHVVLMKLAGIDGVIVDWYGMDDYLDYGVNNVRTLALRDWSRRAGLKFVLCYEDRTIQEAVKGGFIDASNALAHAQATLRYAQSNYFADPSYLRHQGLPVLLNFGPQYFKTSGQWPAIFSALDATNQPAFLSLDQRVLGAIGAFNWPPMWLSAAHGGVVPPAELENYLSTFQQTAAGWSTYVSSAFPRFHDIYAEAGVAPTHGVLADNDGDTLRATLSRAFTNTSALVQLVTWNDYGEGTILEPTREFGYRDLGIIQDLRRQHLEPGFARDTNDLVLATRLHQLRRQYHTNQVLTAELDRVFTNLVSGDLGAARAQMTGLENKRPALYRPSASAGSLRFLIGGYLSAAGTNVERSSNVADPVWAPAAAYEPTTNLLQFEAPLPTSNPPSFFRARADSPG